MVWASLYFLKQHLATVNCCKPHNFVYYLFKFHTFLKDRTYYSSNKNDESLSIAFSEPRNEIFSRKSICTKLSGVHKKIYVNMIKQTLLFFLINFCKVGKVILGTPFSFILASILNKLHIKSIFQCQNLRP